MKFMHPSYENSGAAPVCTVLNDYQINCNRCINFIARDVSEINNMIASNTQVSPEILTQGENRKKHPNFLEANFGYF